MPPAGKKVTKEAVGSFAPCGARSFLGAKILLESEKFMCEGR